jgi:hypothetical protein
MIAWVFTTHRRPVFTTHRRPMFTRRDRPVFTTHSRSMFTTHSRPVFTRSWPPGVSVAVCLQRLIHVWRNTHKWSDFT